jgi:exodeoxyribonuclease VII small subunit
METRREARSEPASGELANERAAKPNAQDEPVADEGEREQRQGEQPQSYEESAARVEEIIRRLDSGEASLGETLELVREGKALIELCAGELDAVAGALEELRLDELVARLEGEAARPGESPAGHAGLGRPASPSQGGTGGPAEP